MCIRDRSLDDIPDALVLPALSSAVNALRLCPGVDFVALSASQSAQPDLLDTAGSLRVVQLPIPGSPDTKLWCDVSLGWPRPLVPHVDVQAVSDFVHGISHAGGKATLKEVSRRFVWPHMRSDVLRLARECLPCSSSKTTRHVRSPLVHRPCLLYTSPSPRDS